MADRGAPTFKLLLAGHALEREQMVHVLSIEYVESIDELDAVTVEFGVPQKAVQSVLGLATFGSPFEVHLGYGDDIKRTVQGDIIEVAHRRGSEDPWVYTLRGLDRLHRLRSAPRTRVWEGSHSSIAETVAREHGFKAAVEGVDGTSEHVLQANIDDARFLMRLAKENNYYLRIQDDTLRFGRRNVAYQAVTEVVWGDEVEDVSIVGSLNDISTSVSVQGNDYRQDETVQGRAEVSRLKRISGGITGVELAQRAFGDREKLVSNAPYSATSNATIRARSELQEQAERFLQGQLTCVGKPEACSGGMLRLKEAGPLSGTYLVRQTRHVLERGSAYSTIVDFVSDSLPGGDGQ